MDEEKLARKDLRRYIGAHMTQRREALCLSMEEMSYLMGFTPSFIGLMERGCRGVTVYNIYSLSRIFNCKMDDFFKPIELPTEQAPTKVQSEDDLREKIMTLTYGLNEKELKFLIEELNGLCRMRDGIS